MGADVMLGPRSGLRALDSPLPRARRRRRAADRRRGRRRAAGAKAVIAAARPRTAMAATRDPLVVFMPSGKRGHFPVGTPLLQAARSLGVDIDSVCGGRALCAGAARCLVAEGEFAKHGVSSSSASLSPLSEPEMRFSRRVPLRRGPAPVVLGARRGRCGHRRARQQPGASSGGAQGGRCARDRAESGACACTTCR